MAARLSSSWARVRGPMIGITLLLPTHARATRPGFEIHFVGDHFERVEYRCLLCGVLGVEQPAAHAGLPSGLALAVFAREQAAAERRPTQRRQPMSLSHRQQLPIRCPLDQTVFDLLGGDRRPTVQSQERSRACSAPGRKIRQAAI